MMGFVLTRMISLMGGMSLLIVEIFLAGCLFLGRRGANDDASQPLPLTPFT